MAMKETLDYLEEYAMRFIGTPYRWGGDDPMAGFDCSGFVQELLASVGMDPSGDQTAQALFDYFLNSSNRNPPPCRGVLCFYGRSAREITHIAWMINSLQVIEAGGGGSKTTSLEAAIAQNAFIRLRHYLHRKDLVAMLLPEYPVVT